MRRGVDMVDVLEEKMTLALSTALWLPSSCFGGVLAGVVAVQPSTAA